MYTISETMYNAVKTAVEESNPNEATEELDDQTLWNLAYYFEGSDYPPEDLTGIDMYFLYDVVKFVSGAPERP